MCNGVGAAVRFGLTERQACFLAMVMLHSAMFVGRQYAAFAGITHGQKVHDFIEALLIRRFVIPIELGSTGRTSAFSVGTEAGRDLVGDSLRAVRGLKCRRREVFEARRRGVAGVATFDRLDQPLVERFRHLHVKRRHTLREPSTDH